MSSYAIKLSYLLLFAALFACKLWALGSAPPPPPGSEACLHACVIRSESAGCIIVESHVRPPYGSRISVHSEIGRHAFLEAESLDLLMQDFVAMTPEYEPTPSEVAEQAYLEALIRSHNPDYRRAQKKALSRSPRKQHKR